MATHRTCKLFVNLPVRDLKRSIEFFTRLGFGFNSQMTDENATCMILGEDTYVMLLTESRLKDFIKKPLHDPRASTAATYAITAANRADVDHVVKTAIAAGGTHAADPMDHGFMYGWSFYDLDGHHWEVFYMDPAALQK